MVTILKLSLTMLRKSASSSTHERSNRMEQMNLFGDCKDEQETGQEEVFTSDTLGCG